MYVFKNMIEEDRYLSFVRILVESKTLKVARWKEMLLP